MTGERPPERPATGKAAQWEREREAAAEALARIGATPRECRVLATMAAHTAGTMRLTGAWRGDTAEATADKAARLVLAEHRKAEAAAGVAAL